MPYNVWATFTYYQGFESETLDQRYPADGTGCSDNIYWSYLNPKANCDNIIRDDITARYGTKYSDTFCDWVDGTDELEVYWRDNATTRTALTTNNANLSTGIFYFIEFAWKTSSNLREIYLNGTELTYAAGDGADISSFDGDVDTLYFGDSISAVSYDVHMDNIIYSTDSTVDLYTVCKDEEEWPE